MSELVDRLCSGEHDVEIALRPSRTVEAFRERLEYGYVHIKFIATRGGTELGMKVDPALSDMSAADFVGQSGQVTVAGTLTLDYVPVVCRAVIELPHLTGKGHLERAAIACG